MNLMSVDIGQQTDYTALSYVQAGRTIIDEVIQPPEYKIRTLGRVTLGTPYPEIVQMAIRMKDRVTNRKMSPLTWVLDATGVGRPVVDMFRDEGVNPIAITIHGGDKFSYGVIEGRKNSEGNAAKVLGGNSVNTMEWHVPKRDLVAALIVAFQNQQLKIPKSLKMGNLLINELVNFRMKIDPKTAHDSYEAWRENVHDDLVLTVAMAVYVSQKLTPGELIPRSKMSGQFNPKPLLEEKEHQPITFRKFGQKDKPVQRLPNLYGDR